MNCERIKELIMTDYIDNELKSGLKEKIESHIKECANCRQLEQDLKRQACLPFRNLETLIPDDTLWQKIRERVVTEQLTSEPAREPIFVNILERIKNSLFPTFGESLGLKRVVVYASILIVFCTLGITGKMLYSQRNNAYVKEEVTDYIELGTLDNGYTDDLGTAIEEFFL